MEKKGNMGKIFKVILLFIFLLLFGLSEFSFAQARLDIPVSNLEIVNPVPIKLVEKTALAKSKETWGEGVAGNPIPLSDFNGNVVAFMVPFYIGGGPFPAYDGILQGIKDGRELRNLINNSEMEKAKEKYLSMYHGKAANPRTVITSIPEIPQRSPIDPIRPDGSPSRKQEIRDLMKFASDKATGGGEFGTIFVSATYDKVPVIAYFHYLAPYYINFDLALEKAEQVIGTGAFLKRIYFLGLEGQYFEFVNNGASTLLNSKTLETNTLEGLKQSSIPQAQAPTDSRPLPEKAVRLKAEISAEWEKIRSEIGGE